MKTTMQALLTLAIALVLISCNSANGTLEVDASSSNSVDGSSSSSLGTSAGQSSSTVGKSSSATGSTATGSFTYGGQTYKTVTLGTQTWMAENLNVATTGSLCFDDLSSNCQIYGRLYTWDAATTACPTGWHLPTDAEWITLEVFLGMDAEVANAAYNTNEAEHRDTTDQGKALKARSSLWQVNSGTNASGFSALPGGMLRRVIIMVWASAPTSGRPLRKWRAKGSFDSWMAAKIISRAAGIIVPTISRCAA